MIKASTKFQQKKIEPLYNQVVPRHIAQSLSIDPIEGKLDFSKARHLLSRCLFGYTQADLDTLKNMSVAQALDLLMEETEMPQPPLTTDDRDAGSQVGKSWVGQPFNENDNPYRLASLHSWWFGQLLDQQISLREKMVLFWHNHFVAESAVVSRADFLYQYNDCLRRNAFGNFQNLAEEITVLPAMLRYLSGETNVAGSPNENYARKLLELFTIGPGENGLQNFMEEDVVEAAKVLTGWEINANGNSFFNAEKHDVSSKVFSEAFNQATIGNEGSKEYKTLINLIFNREETALFLVRKIYRWFVYYAIDDEVEINIIEPLAEVFRDNNYEIKPVLSALLVSQHFFDENLRGCIIKNPVDFVVGTIKNISFPIPGKEQLLPMYGLWNYFFNQAANQEMKLGSPPDAAGWQTYYRYPQFHQLWINAATLAQKSAFTDQLMSAEGVAVNNISFKTDLTALAKTTTKPADVNVLIAEFAARFFPLGATAQQVSNLKEVLLPGLPDFEWTSEWDEYQSNPADETQRALIETKLRNLAKTMFRMANYQLS